LGQHLISKLPDDLPMGGEKALPEAGQQMQPGKRICPPAGDPPAAPPSCADQV
ncbi:MAG: hypothetical protein QOF83_1065, partial [Solirubrobacteraceae bacterium]|nr:hypothetical protein [Solirubrobacteraceae bacterium]